jgi:hypothetical protein
VLWTQLTTFPLEIIAPDEKQFGTGGSMSRTNAYDLFEILCTGEWRNSFTRIVRSSSK